MPNPSSSYHYHMKNYVRCSSCKKKHKSHHWPHCLKKLQRFAVEIIKSTRLGKRLVDVICGAQIRANSPPIIAYWEDKQCELYKIYRIIANHPRLNCAFEGISIRTFILEESPKNTAHFYAGLLWNWRLTTDTRTWTKHLHYVQRCVHLCIKYMDQKDFQIIKEYLENDYDDYFPELRILNDAIGIKSYLWTTVSRGEKTLNMLVKTINHWFLCTPILLELAKFTSWNFLIENRASLLGVDALYGILLNASFNRKPYNLQKLYY